MYCAMNRKLAILSSLVCFLGFMFWVLALKYSPNAYMIYMIMAGFVWVVLTGAWCKMASKEGAHGKVH